VDLHRLYWQATQDAAAFAPPGGMERKTRYKLQKAF